MAKPKDLFTTRMADIESAETLCDIARPLIRAKARRLGCQHGFTSTDVDDIQQEVFLRLVQRCKSKECADCPVIVFIKTILDQSIASQIRDRCAQKRDVRRTRSLDTVMRHAHGRTPGCQGCCRREQQEMAELGLDVAETIEQLAREQQQLCKALGVHSISELARRFETPRTTLSDRVRKLRSTFEDRGLDAYIE